jgi:hypothetical protein
MGSRNVLGRTLGLLVLAPALAACNVEPTAHDECHAKLSAASGCPAAALVVMSDFSSTQIALTKLSGDTLCGSYFSTARAEAKPVAFALSGDVVLPSTRPASGRAVVIDRYGTNVVSFLAAETGALLGQLAVGTGFESNPQDYLEIDERRALVSRWGENPVPGQKAFDEGGDLLVIDTLGLAIEARIPLPHDDFPPRPAGLTRVGDQAVVTLQRMSIDIRSMGDARLLGIALDSLDIAWTLALDGLKNCGPLTVSPDASLGAVACSGYVDRSGLAANVEDSGIVLLELTSTPPVELRRFSAKALVGVPLQPELEWFAPERLLAKTQTALDGDANNRLLTIALDAEDAESAAEVLLEARPSGSGMGQGVVFGGMLCAPGCDSTCLVADSDRGVLERFTIDGDTLSPLGALSVHGTVGLPPRDVGGL